jgi:hypothetical protein
MKSLNKKERCWLEITSTSTKALKNASFVLFILFLILILSCNDNKDISGVEEPSFSIYKTKNDYYYNVHTWVDKVPMEFRIFEKKYFKTGNDTIEILRIRLEDGYVLAYSTGHDNYFTDITFGEFYSFCEKNSPETFPLDSVLERVVDQDPFIEYYYDTSYNYLPIDDPEDLEKINEIIRNGELESYFKKVK